MIGPRFRLRIPKLARRQARRAGTVAVVTLFALGLYSTAVEPYWIEVTHHQLAAPIQSPIKIAHLSDLHSQGIGRRERKLLSLLEEEQPDLIVVTGDSRSTFGGDHKMIREIFAKLHAPLGVWVVRGNHDLPRLLKAEAGFGEVQGLHYLQNESQLVRDDLWLVGLDDDAVGRPDVDRALQGVPEEAFAVGLLHSPSGFDRAAGRLPLALAGHTHGGQVWLPYLVRLWLPPGSGRYLAGWYEQASSRLYVSRGLGTSVLPLRFLARPELAIHRLVPEPEPEP